MVGLLCRQEARRRIVRGKVRDNQQGQDSDADVLEPGCCAAGGSVDDDLMPPSARLATMEDEVVTVCAPGQTNSPHAVSQPLCIAGCHRYWSGAAATVLGGRLSLELHAARLRERRQVQAELQAWVQEVLGQPADKEQQQQQEGTSAVVCGSSTGGSVGR